MAYKVEKRLYGKLYNMRNFTVGKEQVLLYFKQQNKVI